MKQLILIILLQFLVTIKSIEYGMDVSVWQGTIDWQKVKSTDVKFAIARASYGLSNDTCFEKNWKGMIQNGIKPGAYHYYVPSDDAAAQAKHFANVLKSVVGTYSSSFIPAALDIEVTGGQTATEISENCLIFLSTLQNELGTQPMVYTYVNFGNSYLQNIKLADYPLWIANWYVDAPRIPGAWGTQGKNYLYWQYAANGSVGGVPGEGKVDLDRYQ